MGDVLRFMVVGHPEPAGSKKAISIPGRNFTQVIDANNKAAPWKKLVGTTAKGAMLADRRQPFAGPLWVILTFLLKRPQSHYGTGRNAERLKDAAPRYPAVKPDVLKLARAVEDGMTGIVYVDDALIVKETLRKQYAERGGAEGVVVEVMPL